MATPSHIITSGGLISAAFIESVRGLSTRQRGVEPESFALPWAEAPTALPRWTIGRTRWRETRISP